MKKLILTLIMLTFPFTGFAALNFNGTTQYVDITPRINNDEMSIAAWFYKNANDFVNADAIFGGWYWNSNIQLQEGFDLRFFPTNPTLLSLLLVTTNGTTKTQKGSSFNFASISSNGTSTKEWFHVVGTYNKTDGNQRLYVNGVLRDIDLHVAGNTIVPFATTTAGSCYTTQKIGHSCVSTGYFNGRIAEVKLYNRALSNDEIKLLYYGGKIYNGLVGYWPLYNVPNLTYEPDFSGGRHYGVRTATPVPVGHPYKAGKYKK